MAKKPEPTDKPAGVTLTVIAKRDGFRRCGMAFGKTPLEVELKLLKRIPETYRRHAHHWLILHGRYVCKARKPDCPACILRDLCTYEPKTGASDRPPPGPEPADAVSAPPRRLRSARSARSR